MAFDPLLEAGTHRVTWTLSKPPETDTWDVSGEVDLLALRQPRGSVFGTAPATWNEGPGSQRSAGWPQHFEYPLVYGEMNGGLDVVLLDAHLTVHGEMPRSGFVNFSDANAHFDAWAALVGRGAPATGPLLVDSGFIQVPHLEALAGKSPILQVMFPEGNMYEQDEPQFSATFDKHSHQEWRDDRAEVALSYDLSADLFSWYSFGLTFSPIVSVKLNEPVPLSEFLIQWAWPLRQLVAAATGRREDISYLTVSPVFADDEREPEKRQFQVFNASISQARYSSSRSLRDKHISAIRLSEGESLLAMLRRWQDLKDEQNPILNTYDISAVGPSQHPRARFLLLLQALEGLHGHEHRDEMEERRSNHSALREPILSRCKSALTELPDDFRFIKKFLARWPPETSDVAIRKMLQMLPIDLEPELAKSALVESVRIDNDRVTSTLDAIRIARNDLSHGTKAYDRLELAGVADILERAVRGHLLRLLGTSTDAITRALSRED
ncbi:hypothetical protein [Mycobacteroides franklinii]|uniref:Uncharacterized protein n=1 Tax=Mycobacteroides franklinii TaxID=948102 RepID=A0A4R5PG51_9MYCO|nr:hypothetical protein [Mycobacteroides franklinii]TDH24415.1 hypothetical protein EJ571_04640 [Mycobacteroides franklinii]